MHDVDTEVARIAATVGSSARARMLFSLLDGCARTSTELAVTANVSPSTASTHLYQLKALRLVRVVADGKRRYYSLNGHKVGGLLEALSILAADARERVEQSRQSRLRVARTCYDHLAGRLGVSLHDSLCALAWLSVVDGAYQLTPSGAKSLVAVGVDVEATRSLGRRFVFGCEDWTERRPHLGGALGAAILAVALNRKWVVREPDSRALAITSLGRREMLLRFGVSI